MKQALIFGDDFPREIRAGYLTNKKRLEKIA